MDYVLILEGLFLILVLTFLAGPFLRFGFRRLPLKKQHEILHIFYKMGGLSAVVLFLLLHWLPVRRLRATTGGLFKGVEGVKEHFYVYFDHGADSCRADFYSNLALDPSVEDLATTVKINAPGIFVAVDLTYGLDLPDYSRKWAILKFSLLNA